MSEFPTSSPSAAASGLADSTFLKACRGEPTGHTPIWLMRQAGRYMKEYRDLRERVSFLELCKTPDLAAEVTVHAAKTIGADAAILFADILLIIETLGLPLAFNKGEGPSIDRPVRTAADVAALTEVDPDALSFVYEAVSLIRRDLPPEVSLIGFAGAPFTVASYAIEGGSSRNFDRTKAFMYCEPEAWNDLMARISRGTAAYLRRQVEAGAQAVQLFDSWVGALGPEDYREFVLPHSRSILESLPAGIPRIHFGRGTGLLLEAMGEAGADVVGVDFATPLDGARKRLGDKPVQGNLDPAVLLTDRAYIRKRVERILEQNGGRPGHIFNLGHGLLPNTPVDHVIYLIDTVHELSSR